jgi:hypothetical protein
MGSRHKGEFKNKEKIEKSKTPLKNILLFTYLVWK